MLLLAYRPKWNPDFQVETVASRSAWAYAVTSSAWASAFGTRSFGRFGQARYDWVGTPPLPIPMVAPTFVSCRRSIVGCDACPPEHSAQVDDAAQPPHCWVGAHLGYTIANYGMSLTTVGLASELKACGVTVHALWPRTTIATAAIVKHGPPR